MNKALLEAIYIPDTCLSEEDLSKYLNGELDALARKRVETHLIDCELCSDAVDGFRESDLTFSASRVPFSVSQIVDDSVKIEKENLKIRPIYRALIRIAAIGSLLFVSYFTFFRAPSYDQLYAKYYSVYQVDIPLLSRGDSGTSALTGFEQGLIEYKKGNYTQSLVFFEKSILAEPNNSAINFFSGLACMQNSQFDKAIGFLQTAREADSLYSVKACWYLALSYLKLGEKENALSQLDNLIAQGGYKIEEARKLRNKID
jgi:tetratricopeptide (TPR) repeat protein